MMKDCFYINYYDEKNNKEMEWPLEEMVGILLALEMDIDFHIEALKAQAVVIRTNLLKDSQSLRDYDIKPLVSYKDIWGTKYDINVEKINRAVKGTEGVAILFKDKLIYAKYHALCGGSTENAENVMDNQVTYLRRVLCDHCIEGPYWNNEKEFSTEELEQLLDIQFPNIDGDYKSEILNFVEDIEKDSYGRVKSIKIGKKIFSGNEALELLDLNSTRFNIYPTGIRFISNGMGHGLGLCQWGANAMAQGGSTFVEILEYYYTGVDIEKIRLPSIKNPLLGRIIMIDPGHGGDDLGHKGVELGLLEKDIVLKIAVKLKEKLEELGAVVYLTRDGDKKVSINERVEKANRIYPDFFISLHMDYFTNSNVKGLEMFHFRNDMDSNRLGKSILKNLRDKEIFLKGLKEGNFYIFRGINVSSLLIELGYLSNIEEELKFKDENHIKSLVNGIEKGILEHFNH